MDVDCGVDDLVALFEEDNPEMEMNSDDEMEQLFENDDLMQERETEDKMPDDIIAKKDDASNSLEAIKDENAQLKEKLRLLELQLTQNQTKKEKNTEEKSNKDSNKSVSRSDYHGKMKERADVIKTQSEYKKGDKENVTTPFKGKQRTAHVGKREPAMTRNSIDNVNKMKQKSPVEQKEMKKPINKDDTHPAVSEEYSGIRIINPLISSQTMDSRMEGRKFIKMNYILKHAGKNDVNGDWVTVGVIVNKTPPKTASNGKTFSIWKLSDLEIGCENNTVTFFLFGDVYKDHWKTTEGTVIGLLNPSVLPQRDNEQIGGIAITIDDPRKMMIMGTSKDLGRCKGGTKSGKQCSLIVNTSRGYFCEHHVSREYKKIKSQRMEFQSGSGPDPKKGNLMKKFKKDVESGQYSYGGETLTWKERNDTVTKPKNRKLTLEDIAGPGSAQYVKKAMENAADNEDGKNAVDNTDGQPEVSEEFMKRLQIPTAGSRNLMHLLRKEENEEKEDLQTGKTDSKSAKDLLNEEKKQQKKKTVKSVDIKLPIFKKKPPENSLRKFSTDFRPKLARGFDPDDDIEFADFGDTIVSDGLSSGRKNADFGNTLIRNSACRSAGKSGMKSDFKKSDIAKNKAITIMRSKGIKFDKNDEKDKNKLPETIQKVHKKVLEDISNEENLEPSKKRRKGLLEDAFGLVDFDSKEGKKLLESKSKHVGQVRQAEAEREAAYFNALEQKEMYEDKMQNVMEMKVNVVCCKICKYMHEFASSLCKNQGHPTVRVEAIKRFFLCKNCKNRTISYKKLPDHPCKNCGANNYERTSMFQEKKGPKIGGETLLVRGEEHSKFFNSLNSRLEYV